MALSEEDMQGTIQHTIDSFFENNTLAYTFLKSEETNEEHEARMRQEVTLIIDTSLVVRACTIDSPRQQASIWVEQHVTEKTDCGSKDSDMDLIWFLQFTPDGTKISQIIEFVDSLSAAEIIDSMTSKTAI
ncbi:hypothetical protein GGR57DRAFT_502172 [Xylariaceae sp. FL1272]|nr:hypothetical protein GGR57DRAFT_502172 [Xylariaceae sp. FL1272]